MEKEKEKKYTKSTLSRYKKSENGERYDTFLTEKGYQKDVFAKKSIQEQCVELYSFFNDKGWILSTIRQEKTKVDTKIEDDDFIGIIRSINVSDKCSSDEKVSLTSEVLSLESKINEVKKLQGEIDAIYAKIHEVI